MCWTVYSGATTDVVDPLLYNGFVEELVEVLEMKQPNLHVMFIYLIMLVL